MSVQGLNTQFISSCAGGPFTCCRSCCCRSAVGSPAQAMRGSCLPGARLQHGCLVITCPHMQAKEPVVTAQQWELEGVKAFTDSLASGSWMADKLVCLYLLVHGVDVPNCNVQ